MKTIGRLSLLLTLGCVAHSARAADEPQNQLKGLTAVKVNISISNELVDAGMPGARLRSQTELQLRRAGIRVDRNLDGPVVDIEITGCRGPGTNNYACVVSICVNDTVTVARNDEAIITEVWGPNLYVLYLPNGVAQSILDTTAARLDMFLSDWLEVNPR